MVSALLLVIQSVGALFNFQLTPEQYDGIMTAVNSVLGLLVVLGVVRSEHGKGFTDKQE